MGKQQMENYVRLWRQYKEQEIAAQQSRREIEDEMTKLLDINLANEGTVVLDVDQHTIKVQTRFTRKVDADALQEIAAEHGLTNHLSELFRWSADIDLKSWKAAAPEITSVLSQAITTKSGRPSYSISKEI